MKTHTTQAIEDAFRGNYKGATELPDLEHTIKFFQDRHETYIREYLLDPKFWQAIGRTRGWRVVGNSKKDNDYNPESYYKMREFVGLLHGDMTYGLSIEEALGKLT